MGGLEGVGQSGFLRRVRKGVLMRFPEIKFRLNIAKHKILQL